VEKEITRIKIDGNVHRKQNKWEMENKIKGIKESLKKR